MKNWTYKNFTIHEFTELKSTNSHTFELAEIGKISDHEVVFAESQSEGRGRENRSWSSPVGNLYFSLLLKKAIAAEKISQVSFVGILALRNVLEQILAVKENRAKVEIKWPNDLLVNQKKISGILLESKISRNNSEFIVLGIGLNIASNPDNTIFPATNLENLGITTSPKKVLELFLDEFEKTYQNWLDFGFKSLRQSWLKSAYKLNQEISVRSSGSSSGVIEGIFENLDDDGNLLLRYDQNLLKISAGDVLSQ